jgi:hypothetical protein
MDTLAGQVSQLVPALIRGFLTSVQMDNAILTAQEDTSLTIMMRHAMDRAPFGMGTTMTPIALIAGTTGRGLTAVTLIAWMTILQVYIGHPLIQS